MREALLLLATGMVAFGAPADAAKYTSAVIRAGAEPGIRFTSGLMVCDEALRAGHWVNRYWLSTGLVKPEFHLASQAQRSALDSFELAIEDQDLAGTWRWVSASQKQLRQPDGLLVTFTLLSAARPIKVTVQTRMTGGPVMVRWLEVTNTGDKPTAITRVSPWSGMLWDTAQYRERIAPGDAPFELGYAEFQEWDTKARGASNQSPIPPRPSPGPEANPAGAIRPSSPATKRRENGLSVRSAGAATGV